MQFKIKSTKIKISFTFLILFLIFSLSENLDIYFYSIFASFLHELVHVFFIIFFKDSVSSVTFSILGGKIEKANKKLLSNHQEAIINFSAPIFNVALGVAFYIIFPVSRWGIVNLGLGLFNIIPFSVLDGGKGLFYILSQYYPDDITNKILLVLNGILTIIFTTITIYTFFNYNKNYLMILINIYLIASIFQKQTYK